MNGNLSKEYLLARPELVLAADRELYIKDEQVPGLYLRVTTRGVKSWTLQKRIGNKVKKIKIGDPASMPLQEARLQAHQILGAVQNGENPFLALRAVRSWDWTVDQAFARYYNDYLCTKARAAEYKANMLRLWKPIASMPVLALTVNDVQNWVNAIAKASGPAQANKQLTIFGACVRWAHEQQLIALKRDPTLGVKKAIEAGPREQYLTREQMKRLIEVARENPGDAADAIQLLLYTGQRKTPVLAMRWEQIDWEQCVWNVPAPIQKNKKPNSIHLIDAAIVILRSRANKSPWVFPGTGKSGRLTQFDKSWYAIRSKAGIQNDFVLHGLRHTLGTQLGLINASSFTIQRQLGHSSSKMSERYTHKAPVRDKIEEAFEHVAS